MPDLVIFDCDGVLVDSEHIAARTEAAELQRLGFAITEEDVVRRFVGFSGEHMSREVEREFGRPFPAGFWERVAALTREAFERELEPIPGIHDAVERLDRAVCVASSSDPPRVRRCLELVRLWERFDPHVFSASMVERGKPAPDLFLLAAGRMGVEPARALVIEDSVPGVTAARAAEMRVLGFTGASHCGPELPARLRDAGAEAVFDDMRELPDRLAG